MDHERDKPPPFHGLPTEVSNGCHSRPFDHWARPNAPYRCWIWPRIQKIEQMLQLVVPGTFPPSRTTHRFYLPRLLAGGKRVQSGQRFRGQPVLWGCSPHPAVVQHDFFNFVYAIARNPQINLHFLKNHSGKPECAKLYRYVILIDKKPS